MRRKFLSSCVLTVSSLLLCCACCEDDDDDWHEPPPVRVEVQNNLVVELLVFLDDDPLPTLELGPLSSGAFPAYPGFSLYFESLQPVAGQDGEGNDLLMGEIVSGLFPPDPTPPGGDVAYSIESQVGADIFFAPLPVNKTVFDIFSVVNMGVDVPGYPPPPGSGLDCLCALAPSLTPYVIGYYSYSLPGIIAPIQANVHFFLVPEPSPEVSAHVGPFPIDPVSGTVTFDVE